MRIVVWGHGPVGRSVQRLLERGERTLRAMEIAIQEGGLPAEWQDEWALEVDVPDDVEADLRFDPAVLGWIEL